MQDLSLYDALAAALNNVIRDDLVVFEGNEISSFELLCDVLDLSAFLSAPRFSDSDAVTINLPNIPNAVAAFYAVNRAGFLANMAHPLLPPTALLSTMDKTKSNVLITFYDYYKQNKQEIDAYGCTVVLCYISDYLPPLKKFFYSVKSEKSVKGENIVLYRDILKRKHKKPGTESENKSIASDLPAVYLHSGGTTGVPKAIMLSAKSFNALSTSLECVIDNLDAKHNACLSVLPMFHGFGLGVCIHAMLVHGFKVVLMPQFSAEGAMELIFRNKVTLVAGIPKMYDKIAGITNSANGHKLKSLEYCFSGGDKLPVSTKQSFDTCLYAAGSIAEVQEGYGLTECVTVCCVSKKDDFKRNCVGFPLAGLAMDIVDEDKNFLPAEKRGEIVVSGDTLMEGYLENNENPFFERDDVRWLLTGDFGYKDKDGRFYFEGRKKRLIKISGFNVFPIEIEECVAELPFVIESVAIPDDPLLTKYVQLFVRIDKSIDDNQATERIFEHCEKKLLKYSVPGKIAIVDDFPRTPVGKIDESKLR